VNRSIFLQLSQHRVGAYPLLSLRSKETHRVKSKKAAVLSGALVRDHGIGDEFFQVDGDGQVYLKAVVFNIKKFERLYTYSYIRRT
jgi:hypothetical protein